MTQKMFCLRTAMLNLWRHRSKSLLVIMTCMAAVVFVFVYMKAVAANRQQLRTLSQEIPVTASILNLDGSLDSGLYISEETIDRIKKTGHIKDLLCTARLAAEFPSAPSDGNSLKPIMIMAANDIRAVPNMDDRMVAPSDMDMDFLHGEDTQCLAGEVFLQQNHLSIGDTVSLKLYSLQFQGFSFTYQPLGECSLHIVGSLSAQQSVADLTPIDLLCPAGWAANLHHQAGVPYFMDSASFRIADPLKLNAFKAAMKEFLMSANPQSDYSLLGNALTVKDETFITAAGRVKSTLNILEAFVPVVFAMIALVGYAMAFLLMQARRADITVMRSLGTRRAQCVTVMLLEYAVLGLTGSLLGAGCTAFWAGPGFDSLINALLFFGALMLGITVSAIQISGGNTMTGRIKIES